MRGLPRDDRRDPVLAGTLDAEIDRLDPARLSEPEATVEVHDRSAIVDDTGRAPRVDLSLADPRAIEVEKMDAVGVDPAEVGVDERFGHEHRGVALGAERGEHVGCERPQRSRADDLRVAHRSSQPGWRSSRDG